MKTDWDYTELANAYLKRPKYSKKAVDKVIDMASVQKNDRACDIGAGTGHLTSMLAEYGCVVTAIEPNEAMRNIGAVQTSVFSNIIWIEAKAEETKQNNNVFKLVTFGSSFNVANRKLALRESARILKPEGWFVCMWNHRNLLDSIQADIEKVIKSSIKDYDYGLRREDQESIINESNLFHDVCKIEVPFFYSQSKRDCIEAWRSHGTLYRQAGHKFNDIISEIEKILASVHSAEIEIPYTTVIWMAMVKK